MHTEISATASLAAPAPPVYKGLVRLTKNLELSGFSMNFSADEEIFGEQEPADFVYKVVRGAVRTTRFLSDGRRQVVGFHLPDDVFGLETGDVHRFCAEAIEDSEIALVKRAVVMRTLDRDVTAARQLLALTSAELESLQDHLVLLGRKTALERVASFLMKLSRRGQSSTIDLPMSRSDLGDHLGLTLETVSRALSQLSRQGALTLVSPRRLILNEGLALQAM